MKKLFLPLLAILFIIQLSATAQIKKANRLFARYDYANAIPFYKKVIDNNKKQKIEAMQRLADCYRLTSNFTEAAGWYAKVVANPDVDPENYYYYGEALRSNGNSKLAREQFKKYSALKPNDPRGTKLASVIDQTESWKSIPGKYFVSNAEKLNSANSEFSPVNYKEGILFASDRKTTGEFNKTYGWTGAEYLNMFFADARLQSDTTYIFSDPKLFSGNVNEPFHDGPAAFNKNYSLIFFTRSEKKKGDIDSTRFYTNRLKLYSSTFDGAKWSNNIPFPYNSEDYSVGHPALSGDGNTLYFVSDMPGGFGGTDLYVSKRETNGWSKPINMGNTLNSAGNEMFPDIQNDTILYFSSNGLPGLGSLDIFQSARIKNTWTKPENLLAPLNSPADDFGIIFSADGNAGIFSSNRTGGKGSDDLYTFRKVEDSVLFAGFVKDKATLLPIADATVFAWNSRTQKVKIFKTDATGHYTVYVRNGDMLTVKSMAAGFAPDLLSQNISNAITVKEMAAMRDLLLSKFKVNQLFRLENIYYDFDKWNIRADAATELDKVVAFMSENPPILIELGSHTDSRGSFKYNERLSEHRAESAVAYIVSHGIAKDRITAKGYGEYNLVNRCADGVKCTPEEHQANRRTEVKITGIVEQAKVPAGESLDKYKAGATMDIKLFDKSFFELIREVDSPASK
jgi:outer membrane protein OmpA-like peptidoglycan-associated protein/tetratricopeptide (TPR) repeat protein